MKIAFTIADSSDAVHAGGEVVRETHIMELDVNKVPRDVLKHLQRVVRARDEKKFNYESMSISIVKDY